MFEKIDQLLMQFEEMGIPSGDCRILHHGKEVYHRMFGFSDVEKTKPICGDERYFIYSCSKPITVSAAMTLYEKKLFGLDDRLCEYMPEFANMTVKDGEEIRPAKTPITIRQLFTMSAGFSYNLSSPGLLRAKAETNGKCPTRLAMQYLAEDPLQFDPGTRYSYSLCHDVLAALVEVISGVPYAEYVKKTIFDPLGMKDSTFACPKEEYSSLCAQYKFDAASKEFYPIPKTCAYILGEDYHSGGAGCVSTVKDYLRFLEGLRTDAILRPETLALMITDQLDETQKVEYGLRDSGYGYGLGVRCPKDKTRVSDFGWGGAAGAWLMCDKENDVTLYYAQHVLNSPNQSMRGNMAAIVREILTK